MPPNKRPQLSDSVPVVEHHDGKVLPNAPGGVASQSILEKLRGNNPTHITYAQIEEELVKAGFDLFHSADVYDWLLGQLEQSAIKVLDNAPIESPTDWKKSAAEDAEAEAILTEIIRDGDNTQRLLSAAEERRLLEIIRDGQRAYDQLAVTELEQHTNQLQRRIQAANSARNELAERNQRLVFHIAKRFMVAARYLELEDLVQEGNFGLLSAIDKFDLEYGGRFSTYAVWWIRQAISRAMADKERLIRLPVHRVEDIARLRTLELQLEQASGQKPSEETLALHLGLLQPKTEIYLATRCKMSRTELAEVNEDIRRAISRIRYLRRVSTMDPISYDVQVKDGDNTSTLADYLSNDHADVLVDMICQEFLKEDICALLECLSEREQRIIRARFGLDGDGGRTLESIGQDFGVTRERIRQIEEKALKRLRHPRRTRKIRVYIS